MDLIGADRQSLSEGLEKLPGESNYFKGRNSAGWQTHIPQFRRVKFHEVYPHIDLVYYNGDHGLEFDFIIKPGGDPKAIRLKWQGAERMVWGSRGDLELKWKGSGLSLEPPRVYQEAVGGSLPVAGRLQLRPGGEIQFDLGPYDSTRPLIVDPVLAYSTYLGGTSDDDIYAIAVDSGGDAYVTGSTVSTDYPTTPGAYSSSSSGGVVVTKLNPTGNALVYSTFFGGSGGETGTGIAVDASGNAYVAGLTNSTDFPTTPGAFHPAVGCMTNSAFVLKLNPAGSSLIYSTYLNGTTGLTCYSDANAIAIDSAGNAYVTGQTDYTDFPTTPGALQTTLVGGSASGDAYIAKLNPAGSGLVYSTYLGSVDGDGFGIAVDGAGNAYVTGRAEYTPFPTTPGAFQSVLNGGGDAFALKLNPTGTALVYSTLLGGSLVDMGQAIAVDSGGNAYVTGSAPSTDFPTTPGSVQPTMGPGLGGVFVTKVNPTGTGLAYSTFLGGGTYVAYIFGTGIAVDNSGNAYVTGLCFSPGSSNFPTTADALQPTLTTGLQSAFLAELNPSGSALVYSTFLGGDGADNGTGIALDPTGGIYVTGDATSTNFPTTSGAYKTTYNGSIEGFVTKFVSAASATPTATNTATFSPTNTPTWTPTPSPTSTSTNTATPTVTGTPTWTPTSTPSLTATSTPTDTSTPTPTATYTPVCEPHVWPDPFNPRYAVNGMLKFDCLPSGANVSIYTVSGETVANIYESGGWALWDGKNRVGSPVSAGFYYYVIQVGERVFGKGKILVNR
ncbi:MAG TPA: SBBP repeat-containing protein [bacterium]|nr:SBBP repeat-containing protein [bacterium]